MDGVWVKNRCGMGKREIAGVSIVVAVDGGCIGKRVWVRRGLVRRAFWCGFYMRCYIYRHGPCHPSEWSHCNYRSDLTHANPHNFRNHVQTPKSRNTENTSFIQIALISRIHHSLLDCLTWISRVSNLPVKERELEFPKKASQYRTSLFRFVLVAYFMSIEKSTWTEWTRIERFSLYAVLKSRSSRNSSREPSRDRARSLSRDGERERRERSRSRYQMTMQTH